MLKQDVQLVERDLGKQPLSERELRDLFAGRDPRDFLNTRNDEYRARNMKEHPPSADEAIRLMSKNPNLIRRPLVVRGRRMVAGFDEAALKDLVRK